MSQLKKKPLFNPLGDTDVLDRRMIGAESSEQPKPSATARNVRFVVPVGLKYAMCTRLISMAILLWASLRETVRGRSLFPLQKHFI